MAEKGKEKKTPCIVKNNINGQSVIVKSEDKIISMSLALKDHIIFINSIFIFLQLMYVWGSLLFFFWCKVAGE